MQHTSYKLSTIFLSLTLFFSFSLVNAEEITTTTVVEKNEVQSLLSQISSLLGLVESLQKQISAMDNSGGSVIGEFARNMTLGDRGEDVKSLQKLLNSDLKTQIAVFGVGSKGQETDYFGVLTKNAVVKLQELYKDDILTPVGLIQGNGFVGPSTRNKLNELTVGTKKTNLKSLEDKYAYEGDEIVQKNENIDTSEEKVNENVEKIQILSQFLNEEEYNLLKDLYQSNDSSLKRSFALGSASSYTGYPGQKITLDGRDLTDDINIHFEGFVATGTASTDGSEFEFTVPDIKKGPYELTFTNSSSEKALRIMDFVIVVEGAEQPEIHSINPSSGPLGTEITMTGVNFARENNTVNFGQKAVSGIPSEDGETLKVKVVTDIFMANIPNSEDANWPVWVFLANENGSAPVPAIFLIEI